MERAVESICHTMIPYYLPAQADRLRDDIDRIQFHVRLVREVVPRPTSQISVLDIGGGIGLFSVVCARLGFGRVVVVDDFHDPVMDAVGSSILDLHRNAGVEIVERDVIAEGLDGIEGPFDAITTFDSLEHWHHSPRAMLHEAVDLLRPGGTLIIGVPNCVNLRKRLSMLRGDFCWSTLGAWYESETFRGHVREPNISDLLYICSDLGLSAPRVYGRNWLGLRSPSRLIRAATTVADPLLRLRPSLCSDIYVVARKDHCR